MKYNTDSQLDVVLKELATQDTEHMLTETQSIDKHISRPVLERDITNLILQNSQDTSRKKKYKSLINIRRKLVTVLILIFTVSLLGAIVIHKRPFTLRDHVTNSEVIPTEVDSQFSYMVSAPPDYTLYQSYHMGDTVTAVYQNNSNENDTITFKQSKTMSHIRLDTENSSQSTVVLSNGYEGVCIYKDGNHQLFWEYNGFYFSILCTSSEIDVLQIAATLKRL